MSVNTFNGVSDFADGDVIVLSSRHDTSGSAPLIPYLVVGGAGGNATNAREIYGEAGHIPTIGNGTDGFGIQIIGQSNVHLHDVVVLGGTTYGIRCTGASSGNRFEDITINGGGSFAMYCATHTNLRLRRITVPACPKAGIIVTGCPTFLVQDCVVLDYMQVSGNYDGIATGDGSSGRVERCRTEMVEQRNGLGSGFDSSGTVGAPAVVTHVACYTKNAYNGFSASGDDNTADFVTFHGCIEENSLAAGAYIYESVNCKIINCTISRALIVNLANSHVKLLLLNSIIGGDTANEIAAELDQNLLDVYIADYNCFIPGSINTIKDVGVGYKTLAQWHTATGQEGHSLEQSVQFNADWMPLDSELLAAGTRQAGVQAYDSLPLPLHPDIGAVQDRSYPGRKASIGGSRL
jgi:hypothetical protein